MRPKRIANIAERLRRTAVFAAVDDGSLADIAGTGVRKSLRCGQVLFRRGQESDVVILVLSGRLDITRYTERGEQVTLRSLGPDALVGLSIAAGARHSADVVAGEASQVFIVRGDALRAVFARTPDVALRAIVHLASLLAELSDELEEARIPDLEERLRRRLARIGKGLCEIKITHGELAAQVGATRANVSRALKRLEARGLIRRQRGRIALDGLV